MRVVRSFGLDIVVSLVTDDCDVKVCLSGLSHLDSLFIC